VSISQETNKLAHSSSTQLNSALPHSPFANDCQTSEAINYRNILAREIEMKMEIMGIMEKLLDTTVALLRCCVLVVAALDRTNNRIIAPVI
jgi:hypothetical protein